MSLAAQVEPGARHSGYRKERQGTSQLTKSEVPFACRLLRPSSGASSGPARSQSKTSHQFGFFALRFPLIPLHPSSPVLPTHCTKSISISWTRGHTCPYVGLSSGPTVQYPDLPGIYIPIPKAHRRRDPTPAGQSDSSNHQAGSPAVNSRRRPVTRAAQVAKEQPACPLTVTCCSPVSSAIRDRHDSPVSQGCKTQSDGFGTADTGQARSPKVQGQILPVS